MEELRQVIKEVVAEQQPMTVRQVFYQLVSRGAIAKTEIEYKATVIRLLTAMRLDGSLPFSWLTDSTRWMRKPTSYSSLAEAMWRTRRFYRRALWEDAGDAYVEVWCEKEALAGVLYEVTADWDVPLMVTRGYPSLSYLHEAAEVIEKEGVAYLYFFGDFDPSGVDIARVTEARLRQFAPNAQIYFEVLGVTPEQIAEWNLPTRPTKRSDTRLRHFSGESVEVDAIPPDTLRELTHDAIVPHIDQEALRQVQAAEADECKLLEWFAKKAQEAAL